ncbi:hypothetical protein S40285_04303 [Stachybotrys chlorohalonatus IBT 40285]|uniref:PH domain-containing protein n=1 Tax=Stachybotrys chlorohalonatus (strain IBT 40285) TaxID=1283841 RepID=A0A084QQ72_STAC4|nr:hypothetical protein S40285_04303 [Stachybotrys chlorohalonata IBT 40285]
MASTFGSEKPNLPAPGDGDSDPFITTSTPAHTHKRYSGFDQELLAAGADASPGQAKRALEAHLAETDRRLDEAGKLGTALVAQRKAIAEQLQEVDKIEAEGEVNPDLRQKLVDIEKDYNDLARESARVFLPKQRVPSNETNSGSPYPPEGRGGRRSASPSKFESQATGSPTKLSVPNRKIRNQPSNRVHDMAFYAEITSSLITQVRDLQLMLAERDEQLKDVEGERQHLELEAKNLQQRVRVLDENEHRYKEENWNLETRLQEVAGQQREAADREKKLTHALNVSKAEKASTQKELDEVKLSHAKLLDEHAAAVKHHDIELGTAKRNIVMAEGERSAMQRKIDDLTSQNQELAKAFSIQRGRMAEREPGSGLSDEDFETANDNVTPEHSPPPSPVKGTPRHSMLETETMKSSLHHAQRTIQSQRSQLHREKTEKLELRRMIQDLRDDLEKARENGGPSSNRRSRKVESKEFKKPPRLFGSFRTSRQEILLDDPDWEDANDVSPNAVEHIAPDARQPSAQAIMTDSSDHFDTANEGGESAFETANERATETDFVTGNEELSGSDDTETETTSRGFGMMRRPPNLSYSTVRNSSRASFDSTASTSADEDFASELRTPVGTTSSAQKPRQRLSRLFRNSRQNSEEPGLQSSPATASFAGSVGGTPQAGQSLFVELQDMGSDEDSIPGGMTPSRRSARSLTPGSVRRPLSPPPALPTLPKAVMVDSGVMTDPIVITDAVEGASESYRTTDEGDRPGTMESVLGPAEKRASTSWLSVRESDADMSRPVSTLSYSDASAQHDVDMASRLSQFPLPPSSLLQSSPPSLSVSAIQAESIEPVEEPYRAPALNFTLLMTEETVPVTEAETPMPTLSLSTISTENVEPRAEPELPPPVLTVTTIIAEVLEPIAEPDIPLPNLSISTIVSEVVEPKAEPEVLPPALTLSNIYKELVDPIAEPAVVPPVLTISGIHRETVDPIAEPETPAPALTLSSIYGETVDPIAEPEIPAPALTLSSIYGETVDPIAEPNAPVPTLALSSIVGEHIEPVEEPEPKHVPLPSVLPPTLTMSSLMLEQVEPVLEPELKPEPKMTPPTLSMSALMCEHVEPVEEPQPEDVPVAAPPALTLPVALHEAVETVAAPETPRPVLGFSAITSEIVEPREEPQPEPAPVVEPPSLGLSSIFAEFIEPISEPEVPEIQPPPPPTLSLSSIFGEYIEPVAEPEPAIVEVIPPPPPPPQLTLSSVLTETVEPVSEPEVVVPLPLLSVSQIFGEHIEPREEPVVTPIPAALGYSNILTEHVSPVSEPEAPRPSLAMSTIVAEDIFPIAEPTPLLPTLALSPIASEGIEPVEHKLESPIVPKFAFTGIESIETVPINPRSPWRQAFILPRDAEPFARSRGSDALNADLFGQSKQQDSPVVIAEDEVDQVLRNPDTGHNESTLPFREISSNAAARPRRTATLPTVDQGAQTALTSDEIDKMVHTGVQYSSSHGKAASISSIGSTDTTIHRPAESEVLGSPVRSRGKVGDDAVLESGAIRRPGSAASNKASLQDAPPLPANHRQMIEAARAGSSQGSMGPPLWPASATKNRPRTPIQGRPISPLPARGTPTPKAARPVGTTRGTAEVQSVTKRSLRSRQSSVSSFASEIDARFNIRPSDLGMGPNGFGSNTDPRMIQAITQTMIGEFLWKYTRKTGRGGLSENRHRRYFWVHPYTRTLYWSDQDPSGANGRSEIKTKSVPIEAVRVVTDDNPMPPGLHRKSLVVIAPGRTIKFTATTGQRHETWFNALSYLLLRTNDGQTDAEEMAENITSEDVDEFNPQVGRRPANGNRPGAPASLSSYNSRASHNESPAGGYSMNIPTLTPATQRPSMPRSSTGTLSKISGYWKAGGFGSFRGRTTSGQNTSIYEASEAHDSAEDLREMIEQQDRESDRLENVRACCDGKHDVGTLHHHSTKRGRTQHSHSHPTPSGTPTPMASTRSRA